MIQQDSLVEALRKGDETAMTEDVAAVFERHGVYVERERVTEEEKAQGVTAGAIVPKTALDLVIAHHETRRGRMTWGVWERRLEGDALSALLEITDVALPKAPRKGGR